MTVLHPDVQLSDVMPVVIKPLTSSLVHATLPFIDSASPTTSNASSDESQLSDASEDYDHDHDHDHDHSPIDSVESKTPLPAPAAPQAQAPHPFTINRDYLPLTQVHLVSVTSPQKCQWTGRPIRAIVPLPRRKVPLNGNDPGSVALGPSLSRGLLPTSWAGQQQPLARVWDDLDSDSEDEYEYEHEHEGRGGADSENDSGDRRGASRVECCSYESITAAEGLASWSFEELRVECYAQSLVARGTKPPPVIQPLLAIPPAFVPRIVPRESDPNPNNFLIACQ